MISSREKGRLSSRAFFSSRDSRGWEGLSDFLQQRNMMIKSSNESVKQSAQNKPSV